MKWRAVAAALAIVASIALYSVMPFVFYTPTQAAVTVVAAIACLVVARSPVATRQVLYVGIVFAWMATPYARGWPLSLGLPLATWALLVWAVPPLRRSLQWRQVGHFTRRVWMLALACVAVSAAGLLTWNAIARPDVSDLTAGLPPLHGIVLVAAAVGFSLVNAFMEEVVWRGLITEALESVFGPILAIAGQAVSFGLFHVHGFPRGAWGVALACVYGLLLGMLRRTGGGLGAPYVAHVGSDLIVFAILVSLI